MTRDNDMSDEDGEMDPDDASEFLARLAMFKAKMGLVGTQDFEEDPPGLDETEDELSYVLKQIDRVHGEFVKV